MTPTPTTPTDPTTAADEARTKAEQDRAEANRTTQREPGKDSNGNPALYPSEVAGVASSKNLTIPEAEEHLLHGTSVDELVGRRVVYRQSYDQVPATAENHPLVATAVAQAEAANRPELAEPGPDKTQPEAGPYGPHADYRKVTVSDEELAENAGVSVEDAAKLRGVTP